MDTNAFYETLCNALEDGIYLADADGRIMMWNQAAEKITGYKAGEVVGRRSPEQLLNHTDLLGRPLGLGGGHSSLTLRGEVMIRHKSGYRIAVLSKILPVYGEDRTVSGAVEVFTPRIRIDDGRMVDAPSPIVTTDALTGLPNRASLENTLASKFNEHQGAGVLFCVLCLHIDHLADVNSTYGYGAGDKLLRDVADSLKGRLRKTDAIGRWDREKFMGFFTIRSNSGAYVLAERVRGLVAGCGALGEGRPVHATGSVGAAVIRWTDTPASVVERASQLMAQSRERGGNRISVEDMEDGQDMLANA